MIFKSYPTKIKNMNNNENFCNNCGKPGHIFVQCKIPITSYGIIAFRYNKDNETEFLMIRRKDTLGFIDFMRGKYLVQNKHYIMNMLNQMTKAEKELLKKGDFNELWKYLWGENIISNKYKSEENTSKEKYNMLYYGILIKNDYFTLNTLIEQSNKEYNWEEPEWGFPKGRRNYQEKDYDCAIREFIEETGYRFTPLRISNAHIAQPYTIQKETTPFCDILNAQRCKNNNIHLRQGIMLEKRNMNNCNDTHEGSPNTNLRRYKNIQNIIPFEEIFIGSNYKSYKHKYYLMFFDFQESLTINNFEKSEVSKMEWKKYEDCMNFIRPYNLEKKRVITNIFNCLKKYKLFY